MAADINLSCPECGQSHGFEILSETVLRCPECKTELMMEVTLKGEDHPRVADLSPILEEFAAAAISSLLLLPACASTNHDTQNPGRDIRITWYRIETPPSFTTLMFGCFGTDGFAIDQSDGSVAVTPHDPMCPKNGAPWQWVKRSGDLPPVVISTQSGTTTVQPPPAG